MDAAIPAISSARIFEQVLDRCLQIRSRNFEICEPNQYAAPAAYAKIYLHGTIGVRMGDPQVFSVGDIVFARRATRSDSKRGKVDKLMHPYTGLWRIVASLSDASYELEFVGDSKRREKKHASDLSPYQPELIPFQPVDGPDNRYGQLYKPIGASPYKEAGIKGFEPSEPFVVASHFARCGDFRDFHFPTLSELNDKTWLEETEQRGILPDDAALEHSLLYTGPPPSPAAVTAPLIPPVSLLVRGIIDSANKLFFVSHSLGNLMVREWRLVRMALSESSSLSPSCLQDGRFWWSFILCISTMYVIMHATSVTGCSTIRLAISPHQRLLRRLISSTHPIHPRLSPLGSDSSRSADG
jgi:hypothetical protein